MYHDYTTHTKLHARHYTHAAPDTRDTTHSKQCKLATLYTHATTHTRDTTHNKHYTHISLHVYDASTSHTRIHSHTQTYLLIYRCSSGSDGQSRSGADRGGSLPAVLWLAGLKRITVAHRGRHGWSGTLSKNLSNCFIEAICSYIFCVSNMFQEDFEEATCPQRQWCWSYRLSFGSWLLAIFRISHDLPCRWWCFVVIPIFGTRPVNIFQYMIIYRSLRLSNEYSFRWLSLSQ